MNFFPCTTFILALIHQVVLAHFNISSSPFNHVSDYESTNKLIAVIDILVRRFDIYTSVIVDPEAIVSCERVTRALRAAIKSSIRVYRSDQNYSENPFSKVNILCFHRDDNFISFVPAPRVPRRYGPRMLSTLL